MVRVASQTTTINSCCIRKTQKGTPAKIMITSNIDAVVTSLTKFDRVEKTTVYSSFVLKLVFDDTQLSPIKLKNH